MAYLFVIHSGKLDIGTYAVGAGLAFVLIEGKGLRVPPFLIAFAAFLAWALATLPLSLNPAVAYERWADFARFWLISFLLYNAIRTPQQWRIVSLGWLILFALFPFRGIVFNFLTGNMTQGRYAWNFAFRNPNDYAAVALLALTLTIVHLRAGGARWITLASWAGVIGLPAAILLTGSRAGLLGMTVLAAVLLAFSKKRLGILALSCCALLVAAPLLPESTKSRFAGMRFLTSSATVAQADQYGSALERATILEVAKTVAGDNLLIGVGIGNYPIANAAYAATRAEWAAASGFRDSHNTYLTLLAETGIPGLLLFSSAVLLIGKALLKERRAEIGRTGADKNHSNGFAPMVLLAGLTAYALMCATGSYIYLVFPFLYATLAARYRKL